MWDWNWWWFAGYCFVCFLFGVIAHAIGIPGIFAILTGAVVGACAGSWEWFEAHAGNNDY